ncbi:hypothetical protein ACGFZG_25690 [Streptomyces antibioticus]|uniref:hypothetical protein n=1 Tax=Streptomyces antibioticus TaxID=1890 RepID=UPI0037193D69
MTRRLDRNEQMAPRARAVRDAPAGQHIRQARLLEMLTSDLMARAVVTERLRGTSWEEVGEALGVTKATAHGRFSKIVNSWRGAKKAELEDSLGDDFEVAVEELDHIWSQIRDLVARQEMQEGIRFLTGSWAHETVVKPVQGSEAIEAEEAHTGARCVHCNLRRPTERSEGSDSPRDTCSECHRVMAERARRREAWRAIRNAVVHHSHGNWEAAEAEQAASTLHAVAMDADADPEDRWEAAAALVSLGPRHASPPILKILNAGPSVATEVQAPTLTDSGPDFVWTFRNGQTVLVECKRSSRPHPEPTEPSAGRAASGRDTDQRRFEDVAEEAEPSQHAAEPKIWIETFEEPDTGVAGLRVKASDPSLLVPGQLRELERRLAKLEQIVAER